MTNRYFKGSELLVDLLEQDYALDTLCLGCMLSGMMSRKKLFFDGHNNYGQLIKVTSVSNV